MFAESASLLFNPNRRILLQILFKIVLDLGLITSLQ